MKKALITLLSLSLMLVYSSCNNKSVKVHGIDVSPLLNKVAKEQNIDYCKLLEKALNGDTKSILQISLLEFYDGCGYDHGAVLVDLIRIIGEESYINSIGTTNETQRHRILSYVEVGLCYTTSNVYYSNKTVEDEFPRLYAFLSHNKLVINELQE